MKSIYHSIFDPLILLWTFIGVSFITLLLKRKILSLYFFGFSLLWLFLISISPLPQWLILNLEKQYPVIDLTKISKQQETHILILGAGHTIAPSLPPTNQLMNTMLSRLTEAIRLHYQIPGSKLVCSGFSSSGSTTQAETVALAALNLGVQPSDTLIMTKPANTADEAGEYALRFGDKPQLILVTSAFHMPRAMKYFQREGLDPIPAPADHYLKIDPQQAVYNFKPSISKMQMMEKALHEYGGLVEMTF